MVDREIPNTARLISICARISLLCCFHVIRSWSSLIAACRWISVDSSPVSRAAGARSAVMPGAGRLLRSTVRGMCTAQIPIPFRGTLPHILSYRPLLQCTFVANRIAHYLLLIMWQLFLSRYFITALPVTALPSPGPVSISSVSRHSCHTYSNHYAMCSLIRFEKCKSWRDMLDLVVDIVGVATKGLEEV